MKKFCTIFLLLIFILNTNLAMSEVLHGTIEKSNEYRDYINQKEMYTGEVETLERKDVIEMTVSQVIDSTINIEGDEFFAEVTTEVYGDKGVIIPKGTVAHGKISQTIDPRRLGRSGWVELNFDYLITPDGREIPIEGTMSTKLNPVTEAGKIVAEDVGYTLVGGVVGGFMALNWFGLEAAIASQGYTLAGGAAVGGAVGLASGLIRKGKDILIAPGDQIKVKINSSVELPVYQNKALEQKEKLYPGLDIFISNVRHEKDPFDEANTITLTIMITNMSDKIISGLDLTLMNDYNVIYRPSIFGDTKLMFKQIKPGDKVVGDISFAVDNINRTYWLAFNDRRSGEMFAKISIDNAYRNVSNKTKKKNEKIRKHNTNFEKEDDLFDIE
ncbi:MAG: hypothetical protein R3Y28_07985 [Candidatus Gastranaerophilales bacterium]